VTRGRKATLEDQILVKEGFRVLRKETFLKLLRADIYVCFMLQICTVMRKADTLLVNFKGGS